jgi:hypothetical protein
MILGPTRRADLSVRDRELLHLASLDPGTRAILSRYVHLETAVGVVAGIAIGLAGGIMAAIQSSSTWWGLVPVGVAAALSGGVWVRSRRWVTKVRRSLISPAHASTWSAHFVREPVRRYPYLPGRVYADLGRSSTAYGRQRVPLMGGQRSPTSRQQPVMATVIAGSRHCCPTTVIIVDDALLFASPAPVTSSLRRLFCRMDRS